MASVTLLGRALEVAFLIGEGAAADALDEPALLQGLGEMAALVNSVAWPDAYRDAFDGMKKIVFFEGKVQVNDWLIDRPCCDEDDAVFYWEANEFNRNTDADVRANTFFHDCWHVVQFKVRGGFAQGDADRVEREVDAIDHQIEVARLLGCDDREINYLIDFRNSQALIKARLAEGVDRMVHTANA